MPRISDFVLLQMTVQPTLYIRTRTRVENLPQIIGESYGKMAAYLGAAGELPSGVPYVAYHNMDMQDLDVEIGFPVSKALPEKGELRAGSTPAGKAVFCMYLGAYREMAGVYDEMAKWILSHGHTPSGAAYEFYYNGPDRPENELLTMILMPAL